MSSCPSPLRQPSSWNEWRLLLPTEYWCRVAIVDYLSFFAALFSMTKDVKTMLCLLGAAKARRGATSRGSTWDRKGLRRTQDCVTKKLLSLWRYFLRKKIYNLSPISRGSRVHKRSVPNNHCNEIVIIIVLTTTLQKVERIVGLPIMGHGVDENPTTNMMRN